MCLPFAPIAQARGRPSYDTRPMLSATWGIPLPAAWAETKFDTALVFDLGSRFGQPKNRFRVGLECQFWNNKSGNTAATNGQRASTPMVRTECHF